MDANRSLPWDGLSSVTCSGDSMTGHFNPHPSASYGTYPTAKKKKKRVSRAPSQPVVVSRALIELEEEFVVTHRKLP